MRRRKTYGAHHVGRLRIRAAAILAKAFPEWDIYPEDISPARGAWRTDWRNDVYRWEVFTRLKQRARSGDAFPVVAGCWFTLTEFVRHAAKHGCHMTADNELYPNSES